MYLIDGNNVMGQRPGWHRDRPAAQRRLLNELAELSRLKQIRIKVVFDGHPFPNLPDGARFRGVEVLFARPGSDADHRIIDLVERDSNHHNLTVVTSDGALRDRIRAEGVRTIRSGELRRMIDELAPTQTADEIDSSAAGQDLTTDEMGGWLRYFGVDDDDPEEA